LKKTLIINGHPNKDSLCFAFAEAYKKGAEANRSIVKTITISELHFDPNLRYGYQKKMELEPDLLAAWELIQWADHLVWLHPVWWGSFPAIMKGFIDRLFLPGLAFKYQKDSIWWDQLLKGKTAHIITTLDQPAWYYSLFFGKPSVNQLKKSILEFCGIKPVKVTYIGVIRSSNEKQRKKWIEKVKYFGSKLK